MSISTADIESIVKKIVSEMTEAPSKANNGYEIPVGISNRHIHLTKEDLETLFGAGYELTHLKDLSQPGQYACKETLTIVGPSMRAIEGVRVLGPLRKASQVEISVTDSYVLKVKPPVLTAEEKKAWIATQSGVTVGSDAFFPFGDNVERARKSGVQYIAEPGGSIRDDHVIMTANKYNMVMSFTGMRLFHH